MHVFRASVQRALHPGTVVLELILTQMFLKVNQAQLFLLKGKKIG